MLRWYVIQSEPCQEVRAAMSIAECGFQAYLPLKAREPNPKRPLDVARPLFPSYVFAEFDIDDRSKPWQPLVRSRGVQTILGLNRMTYERPEPFPVPVGFIELLRNTLNAKGGVMPLPVPEPLPHLMSGARVVVTQEPFVGIEALVQHDDGNRVRLLLDILGGLVPTIVSRESVHAKC